MLVLILIFVTTLCRQKVNAIKKKLKRLDGKSALKKKDSDSEEEEFSLEKERREERKRKV